MVERTEEKSEIHEVWEELYRYFCFDIGEVHMKRKAGGLW
jgi:hypothetical protein